MEQLNLESIKNIRLQIQKLLIKL